MLSHKFSHVPSLPHHTHVSERAKATLGVAEASQVGEASEASEPTCMYEYVYDSVTSRQCRQ